MIAFLLGIPSRLKLWAAAALGALVAVLAVYGKGRSDQKAKTAANDAKAYRKTVERVADEKPSNDTTDALRERMRQRAKR